jgi:SAM-dependent methyltransferase
LSLQVKRADEFMEPQLLREQASLEKMHWWFVARRKILDRVVAGLGLPAGSRILEAGCGTGGNLHMLARHGEVFAFDVSETARRLAAEWGTAQIAEGFLPDGIPFDGEAFELVVLLDVLEHIEDDGAALRALRTRLKPGGRLLITVPALPSLWSCHDERHQHYRRYRKAELAAKLRGAGYELTRITYFNTLLFPLVGATRLARRLIGGESQDDLVLPSPWLNGLLKGVFGAERNLVGRFPLPIGVSLLAIARLSQDEVGEK